MRIISGKLKGRRFSPPKNFSARPTTDIAKESLFNVLANRIDFEDLKALDLFSGTGSISYELASRECADVTSIELDPKHHAFIKSTIFELNIESQVIALRADVFRYLKKCSRKFDFIFADPPFTLSSIDQIPDLIFDMELLNEDGLFIIEHSNVNNFASHPHFLEVKNYGKVHFSFFK